MLISNWATSNPRVQPIGLDIGHSTVKMVQVAFGEDRARILAARRIPIDTSLARDTQEGRCILVSAIRQLLAEGDFKGRKVISALPFDRLRITSLRLAEAEAPQADKALRREAAERFGLNPQEDVINYIFAGSVRQGDELKNEYILFATDSETIRDHIALLEEAGLAPAAIDAPCCALFRGFERTMRRQEDQEKTVIFADVGHRYTMVVFGRAGEICFAKQIPIGTGHFDGEIASSLGIAVDDAELLRLKLQRDEAVDPATRRHVVDALNTIAEQLAGEMSLCLRYYTVTFRGKRVERAVIAGGGAYEQVLLDVLRRHLSVQIEVAAPLRGLDLCASGVGRDGEDRSADLALAIGLSLKGWEASAAVPSIPVTQEEPALEGELS